MAALRLEIRYDFHLGANIVPHGLAVFFPTIGDWTRTVQWDAIGYGHDRLEIAIIIPRKRRPTSAPAPEILFSHYSVIPVTFLVGRSIAIRDLCAMTFVPSVKM